ncbi:Phospholipase ytpA [Acholeplasma oculi]|uniref:Alpha/beta hydrolase n=1 Tax=Acholeplasma oculi TaxID=35623 RepID=A0A061AA28_9MOLU|nr:alpha/beta fold hydrolase [Acholeplasma oculi]CDR30755.1 Alpha/beta hydrolase [Acholeplasma oculi]SKC34863.1 Lysophospholipase, alpha-beta hydrolase superfamily [Acholeplasma oculi]SUT89661.1 Phospholipase ytpA [Acholeplasma oculi]
MLINQVMLYTETHPVDHALGTVVITHGIALHSLYYRRLAKLINQSGYQVLLYDVRGHGKSQGKRGDIDDIKTFIEDLNQIIIQIKKDTSKPVYLLGHSMGGVISKYYAATYDNYDGLIVMSSPNSVKKLGVLQWLPMFLVGNIRIKTNFQDSRLSNLPPDENVEPYALKSFTIRLIINVLKKGLKYIRKNISRIQKPVLTIHGSDDQLVSIDESISFDKSLKNEHHKFVSIQGGYHNLNHDTVTDDVGKVIGQWLNQLEK